MSKLTKEQRIAIYQAVLDKFDSPGVETNANCIELATVTCEIHGMDHTWYAIHKYLPEFDAFRAEVNISDNKPKQSTPYCWFYTLTSVEEDMARQLILEMCILDAKGKL